MSDSAIVYNGVALSGTNTVKSSVAIAEARNTTYHISVTGTPTGTLSLEVNTLPDRDYQAAVVAAGSEAANTTGWIQHDLRGGNMNPHVTTATQALSGAALNLHLYYPPGAYRTRLSYTNASGTGTINAYRRHIKVV